MTAGPERRPVAPTEILSPEELGRRTHETMIGFATGLQATPEFTSALGAAFFAPGDDKFGRKKPNDGITFDKGNYHYVVNFTSARPNAQREWPGIIELSINKFDNSRGAGLYIPVSSVRLKSNYTEEGRRKKFVGGNALLETGFEPDLSSPYDNNFTSVEDKGSAALDKAKKHFNDILTPVTL